MAPSLYASVHTKTSQHNERTQSYMTYSCNSCDETWNRKEVQKEIQKATWTGAIFRPECYDTMRAAFISQPELFKAWKAEHGFA